MGVVREGGQQERCSWGGGLGCGAWLGWGSCTEHEVRAVEEEGSWGESKLETKKNRWGEGREVARAHQVRCVTVIVLSSPYLLQYGNLLTASARATPCSVMQSLMLKLWKE